MRTMTQISLTIAHKDAIDSESALVNGGGLGFLLLAWFNFNHSMDK